jgi:hypothetical protein
LPKGTPHSYPCCDVISAAGGCQYLAVKMAGNTEALSAPSRSASGTKNRRHSTSYVSALLDEVSDDVMNFIFRLSIDFTRFHEATVTVLMSVRMRSGVLYINKVAPPGTDGSTKHLTYLN